MMTNEITWFSLDREILPSALFGNLKNARYGQAINFDEPKPDENHLAIGYVNNWRKDRYAPPSLIVVGDNTAPNMFSWLRTYAPATSPLSQFARVVTEDDWRRFRSGAIENPYFPIQREDLWACLVLGEALAQADGDTEINNIPISIASSCFSTAVARVAMIYGTEDAMATCIDRLKKLEIDSRFLQRTVSISSLAPAWSIMNFVGDEEPQAIEAATFVVDAVSKLGINTARAAAGIKVPQLTDFPGLLSDSIEERVLAYQRLMNELSNLPNSITRDARANALVAAAVFLIGRGTSHSFLMRRSSKLFTSSFVWYGLIAALAGPSSWDDNWARTTKGIERLLRTKFDWTDSPSTDLCWAEYYWLARVYNGGEVFYEMPKMFPKGLSIEVLPGANCQLRFSDTKSSIAEGAKKQKTEVSPREKELETALAQFLSLAAKSRQLLEGTSMPTPPQRHLELEEPQPPARVIRTTRRIKRTSTD